jgi:hypothetical protein
LTSRKGLYAHQQQGGDPLKLPILVLLAAIPVTGIAQTSGSPDALAVTGKLHYHATVAFGPISLAGDAAYAAILHKANAPLEWEQGAAGYGRRLVSTVAWSAIHNTLAFGLDSALHQDPRYFRSTGRGFWRRSGHALRGTMLTRTDRGGETVSTWRIGSAYGSAFISNLWYPDRLNTVRLGFIQGSVTLGFDLAGNLGREFWPEIKRKVFKK